MNNSIIDKEIEEAFHQIALSLEDFKKILNSIDHKGRGANFLVALCGLAITEPIAKLYYPYVFDKSRGKRRIVRFRKIEISGNTYNPDHFGKIPAKQSVYKFYKDCFNNKTYSDLSSFIWGAFRNGHVHLFFPKKIIDFPLSTIDNSFLTGVHWPCKLDRLDKDIKLRLKVRKEHLKFYLYHNKKGIIRPVFRFIPHIYYYDLEKAIAKFRRKLKHNKNLRMKFHKGYQLLVKDKRLSFPSIHERDKKIIIKEISKFKSLK